MQKTLNKPTEDNIETLEQAIKIVNFVLRDEELKRETIEGLAVARNICLGKYLREKRSNYNADPVIINLEK